MSAEFDKGIGVRVADQDRHRDGYVVGRAPSFTPTNVT